MYEKFVALALLDLKLCLHIHGSDEARSTCQLFFVY